MSTDDWSCCHAIKSVSGANLHIIAFHRKFSESNSINCPLKQYIFPKILGVDWLYGAFSIDEHPSNPPSKLAVWCKSMQVNILRDFTEITMHVLQGQLTPKILSFPLLVWTADSPFHPLQFGDGNIFLFQADMEYRTGHISLLIQQPLIIIGHEKTRLAYSQSH